MAGMSQLEAMPAKAAQGTFHSFTVLNDAIHFQGKHAGVFKDMSSEYRTRRFNAENLKSSVIMLSCP